MLANNNIKKLVVLMGFAPQDGKRDIYFKSYSQHDGYVILVDFNDERIDYAPQISLGDATTSNFSMSENFVVLECVNRLLEKGYKPQNIELEKKYPLGRNMSGKLDVIVYDDGHAPFLMIECKTWGKEYLKESEKMLRDGGQLFSYYAQDRDAKYLCLYASHVEGDKIAYRNSIVVVQDDWRALSGTKEIHDYWNKNFSDNGIFEDNSTPYNVKHKALTYGMLKSLNENDSGKIFNQIMEILRHNAISDKPNAFNKLLNLFVCKIIDENKNTDDELKFQWLETDTDESLQMRLNDLYKDGMWRFLEIRVTDHSDDEVSKLLEGVSDDNQRQLIRRVFMEIRLKKSPNFAFVEVLDDRTFVLNAKIVREMVELLQTYKFRYEQRHEFLGNFFELLLNTSMKQETGQFFTPMPIARFIISSLPLKELVQSKIDEKEHEVLPAVIDYACGSGHFLTEYMSYMQNLIDQEIDVSSASPDVKKKFKSWTDSTFSWVKDSVYGIDLDNRLVKTTKVSAFFNGDGEANVVWANGLDNFYLSDGYRGKLKLEIPRNIPVEKRQDNGQFDILISNPPYSVEAFKSTLRHGEKTFGLYENITYSSSEIECLFVERMKQLLKVGGWGGVILPSSMLSNGGVHSRAREIIFKYFKVKAIAEFGSGTFMKTGTNTVVFFLERREDSDHVAISRAIEKFFSDKKDVTVSGIERAFSKYAAHVHDEMSFDDYVSFVRQNANESAKKHEMFLDYSKAFGEEIYFKSFEIEKEKMLYFLLTYPQKIVLIKSGAKQEEKEFLGYEFSERRGHEGMKWLPGGTKLYDKDESVINPQKANSYVYNAFLGKQTEIDESLTKHVSYRRMSELFNYGASKFYRVVNLSVKKRISLTSTFPLARLGDVCEIISGQSPEGTHYNSEGLGLPFYQGKTEFSDKFLLEPQKWTTETTKKAIKNDVVMSVRAPVGPVNIVTQEICIGRGLAAIRCGKKVDCQYLFCVLNSIQDTFVRNSGAIFDSINRTQIEQIKIPLPPLDIQQKIIAEIKKIENNINQANTGIFEFRKKTESLFEDEMIYKTEPLGRIVDCNPSKSELDGVDGNTEVSFVEMASVSNEGNIANPVTRPLLELRKGSYTYFKENDIIVAKITPCMENGKCALATGLKNGLGMGSSEFHVFRGGNDIIPRYLFGYLNRQIIREEAAKWMTGASGHRRVPISFYQQLKIPLPPLEKQHEIVDEIERHEAEIARLNSELAKLKGQKAEVFAQYFSPNAG